MEMKMKGLFALVFLFLFVEERPVAADSCCGSDSCDETCPWNGACNNGLDYSCMDNISGVFKCRDRSVCTSYFDCDDHDAALRSGQLCNGFPWFNGGYPFSSIKTESELKTYNCTKPSSNGNYCKQWDSLENSVDEFEIGKTTCLVESTNGNYCQEWETTASEYKKCWIEYYPPTSDDNGIRPFCCGSSSSQVLSCCQNLCPVGFYNNPQTQYEKSTCSCQAESKNGLYCSVWYCAEQTLFSLSATHSDQPIEHEWYTCSDVNEATSSNSYCSAWDGDIDSREEFEVASCACQTSSANNAYCVNWFCFEKGYDYWWPNMLWVLLSSILGGLPLFVIALESEWFWSVYFWVPYFVWSGGFIVIGVWMAGIGVALISAAVLYVFPWMIWLAVHGVSRAKIPGYNAVNRSRLNNRNYEVEASHVELEMATAVAIAEVEEK